MDATETSMPLEAVLKFAANGYSVFPCSKIDKRPLTAHGKNDATRDEAQIRDWYERYNAPAWGSADALVLDIERKPHVDGYDAYLELSAEEGDGGAPVVLTGQYEIDGEK